MAELTPERIKYLRDWVNYFVCQFGQMADKVRDAQKLPPETEVHLGLFDVQIAKDLYKVLDGYASLEADAALGRAVRGMEVHYALGRVAPPWWGDTDGWVLAAQSIASSWGGETTWKRAFSYSLDNDCLHETPEQALGLKEGA